MNPIEIIPLFPLGLVLLPEMIVPLHIFEERYKSMIRECLTEEKEFGIVYYDGKEIKSAGCMASIEQVTKRYADGRLDIICRGQKRFYIENILEDKEYLQAEVTFFDDQGRDNSQIQEDLMARARELIDTIVKLTQRNASNLPPTIGDPHTLSFLIAGIETFSAEEKQEFLEMDSTAERLEKGVKALEQAIERIRINSEIRKIIDGNGHLPDLIK
ncbi:MAG: LON peptidase substrate-binding domain-containing protein [bacterium]|nr:MAG: LON peptidase substrate-binding domain-containing protein [bacterium]